MSTEFEYVFAASPGISDRGTKNFREPLNKGATPPRNSPISEGTLNLQASKLDLSSDSLDKKIVQCSDGEIGD